MLTMENEERLCVGAIVLSLVLGATLGVLVASAMKDEDWQHDAIKRGYGQYCPTTGDWAWKGECDD
jgi:hypothetical protein